MTYCGKKYLEILEKKETDLLNKNTQKCKYNNTSYLFQAIA